MPIALEFLVEVSYPVGPEFSSTICWAGGQALGGIFIIISGALQAGANGNPPDNLRKALIFEAVIAMVAVPPALMLGVGKWSSGAKPRRLEIERMVVA